MKRIRDRWIFYLMFGYIMASFVWWAVLFLRQNAAEFREDEAAYRIAWIEQGGDEAGFLQSDSRAALQAELRKRNFMILGEGLVFVTLIAIGFWRIDQSFRREIELTRQQNNFILSITHELKSPLASIKLSMQTLLRRALGQDQVERIAGLCVEDVERLESLVENILLASRIENPDFRFDRSWFDLSGSVTELITSLRRKFPQTVFAEEIQPGIRFEGDEFALTSVVINLIENAVKYGPKEGTVTVGLEEFRQRIRLVVADEGAGVPEAERARIFRRFYRIGNEETRAHKGTGLGLYIVDRIVREHGGSIAVESNRPRGARFVVELPRSHDADAVGEGSVDRDALLPEVSEDPARLTKA